MENSIPHGYKGSPLGITTHEWEIKRVGMVDSRLSSFSFSREQMANHLQRLRDIHYGDIYKDEFCYNKSYSNDYPNGSGKKIKVLNRGLMKVINGVGRAHGLLKGTTKDFFNIEIYIPFFAEQTAIAEILTNADSKINLAKQKLALLYFQMCRFMQQLLTGIKIVKI